MTHDDDTPTELPAKKVYSVTELSRHLKAVIEGEFRSVWLEGEVSNFKIYGSGHTYFTLKDENAQISGVMWKGSRRYLKFEPKDGDHILCRGRLSVYEKRGDYQIVVDSMEPVGLGALQAAFNQLKEKLEGEGLFAPDRKQELPYISWTVGIVTSPTGAVIRDMIRTINRRFPGLRIILAPAAVQGDGAALQIATAIDDLNAHGHCDVIIVGRGGGSIEDLWAFNEEVVARAIVRSKIPIISAVGHETDFTIADFVADQRASTPTAAAEIIAPERREVEDRIESYKALLIGEVRGLIESFTQTIDDLGDRGDRAIFSSNRHRAEVLSGKVRSLKASSPNVRLLRDKERFASVVKRLDRSLITMQTRTTTRTTIAINRLGRISLARIVADRQKAKDQASARLTNALTTHTRERSRKLRSTVGMLDAVSPLAVLSRGYAIVKSPDGATYYRDASRLSPGDKVKILLAKGSFDATVDGPNNARQRRLF